MHLLSNAILLVSVLVLFFSYIHVCGTDYVGLCTHEAASVQRIEELLKGHLRTHVLYPFRTDDLHHCQYKQRLGVPLIGEPPSCLSVWRAGTDCEEGLHYYWIITHCVQEARDDPFTKQPGPCVCGAGSTAPIQGKWGTFPGVYIVLHCRSFRHECIAFSVRGYSLTKRWTPCFLKKMLSDMPIHFKCTRRHIVSRQV